MKKLTLATVILALAIGNLFAADKPELPAKKQTVLELYLTAKEAYEKWEADKEGVNILDVRTPEEYLFVGHPAMARNIPFMFVEHKWNAAKKSLAMKPNENFVADVEKVYKPDDTILITCRSGGRSAAAVNALAKAGFKNVFTITDGFEGDTDKDPESKTCGKRTINGWKNSDIPWTFGVERELMYLPEGE